MVLEDNQPSDSACLDGLWRGADSATGCFFLVALECVYICRHQNAVKGRTEQVEVGVRAIAEEDLLPGAVSEE